MNLPELSLLGLIFWVLDIALFVAATWAFLDCARRRSDAFPAIGRSSKTLWLVLTGLAAVYGLAGALSGAAPTGIFAIAAIVITGVYLLDIRPKIIEITSGR